MEDDAPVDPHVSLWRLLRDAVWKVCKHWLSNAAEKAAESVSDVPWRAASHNFQVVSSYASCIAFKPEYQQGRPCLLHRCWRPRRFWQWCC